MKPFYTLSTITLLYVYCTRWEISLFLWMKNSSNLFNGLYLFSRLFWGYFHFSFNDFLFVLFWEDGGRGTLFIQKNNLFFLLNIVIVIVVSSRVLPKNAFSWLAFLWSHCLVFFLLYYFFFNFLFCCFMLS